MSYGPFYKVPTVDFSGKRSFAYVNPRTVSSIEPDMIDEGEGNSARTITGSRVITPEEIYFVPLSPAQTALKLDIILSGDAEEAHV
jgi:hypothetical protein